MSISTDRREASKALYDKVNAAWLQRDWSAAEAAMAASTQNLIEYLEDGNAEIGDVIYTVDGAMTVAKIDGMDVQLTKDGLPVDRSRWHTGPYDMEDAVYYEAWSGTRRDGHGWAHPVSRRIAQSG